jgi:uncharacterized damage-inducible protein DinB
VKLSEIRELIDYHYWATYRMLEGAASLSPEQFTREMGSSFGSVRNTLVHLYSAEWAWLSRWNGVSPTAQLPPETFPDIAVANLLWRQQEAEMRRFWDTVAEDDLGRVIDYRNLSGQAYSQPLQQMLQHTVNHGTYHRGQLVTMLRQLGAAPPKATDLIVFYRERG